MSILEDKDARGRSRIAIVGTIPEYAKAALKRRGYECYSWELGKTLDDVDLRVTEAVIVIQKKADFVLVELTNCIQALNFGCRVYVKEAVDPNSSRKWERTRTKLSMRPGDDRKRSRGLIDPTCFESPPAPLYAPYITSFIASNKENWEAAANKIACNLAGSAPNQTLQIDELPNKETNGKLDEEQRLLIRRAFSDCRSIRLINKSNGLSGVGTYEVHAYSNESQVGTRWPYRFFVKIGNRDKVQREFANYCYKAIDNVPFHLGPRLIRDRCCLGATQGLIVCHYVAGAEPLRDCARDGRGTSAIANLFNQTLWSWRRAATEEGQGLGELLVTKVLSRPPPTHRQPLYGKYNAKLNFGQLKDKFKQCKSTPVLTGTVHGDLHATNVLVRQGDAVIIDLEKVDSGWPLVFDAASLEAGLLIDGFIKDPRSNIEIFQSVTGLYTRKAFQTDDHHCDLHSASHWFYDSVRQIRMQARQLERDRDSPFQYAWTLAAVLIHKACNGIDFKEIKDGKPVYQDGERREELRAMAYGIAEIILGWLNPSRSATDLT